MYSTCNIKSNGLGSVTIDWPFHYSSVAQLSTGSNNSDIPTTAILVNVFSKEVPQQSKKFKCERNSDGNYLLLTVLQTITLVYKKIYIYLFKGRSNDGYENWYIFKS